MKDTSVYLEVMKLVGQKKKVKLRNDRPPRMALQ